MANKNKPEPETNGMEGLYDNSAPEGWSDKIQTSFPPYWRGDEGSTFTAKVVQRDDSNPDFERYVLQALRPVQCFRGPKNGATEVMVAKGDLFTCGIWTNLNLDGLIGLEVFVKAKPNIKANTPAGFVRDFEVILSPESRKILTERRMGNPVPSELT